MGDLLNVTSLAAGFLFLLNPCSFALLPSYLGVFLNVSQEETATSVWHSISKAQRVALAMSAGLLAVFFPVALIIEGIFNFSVNSFLGSAGYWLSIIIGVGLALLGLAMLLGANINFRLPKVKGGETDSTLVGMFLYGVSYAIAAMGCSLPILIVGLTVTGDDSATAAIGAALSFAVGMVIALITLTVAIATGASSVVGFFRKIMTKMNLITGIILIPAGVYLAYYGWWSLDPINRPRGPVAWQQSLEGTFVNWLEAPVFGDLNRAVILGLLFIALNIALAILGYLKRPGVDSATAKAAS